MTFVVWFAMVDVTPSPPRGLFSWREDMRSMDARVLAHENRISVIEGSYLQVGDFRTLK